MKSDTLGVVGKKLRQIRKEKNCNLKEIAEKSGITAGLLSKIENYRTIPSLPVLHNISLALKVPLSEILKPLDKTTSNFPFVLVRKGHGEKETHSDSEGLLYENLIFRAVETHNIKVSLVNVAPDTQRTPLSNSSMEIVFVVSGSVLYTLAEETIRLHEGDTLFFDGMTPHTLENTSETQVATLFNTYLMYADISIGN